MADQLYVRNTFLEVPDEDDDQPMPLPQRPRAQTDQSAMPRKVKYRQDADEEPTDDTFGFADDGDDADASGSPTMYRGAHSNSSMVGNVLSSKTPTPHMGYMDHEFGIPRSRSNKSNKLGGRQQQQQHDPHAGGGMPPPYAMGYPPMGAWPYMYPGGMGGMPGMPGFPPMPGMPPFMGVPPMMGPGGMPMMPPFPGMQMPGMEVMGGRRSRADSGMSGGKSPKAGASNAAAGGGRGAGRGGGTGRGAGARGAGGAAPRPAAADTAEVPENATTVMLRNIPNRYSQSMLLALLDEKGFMGQYDFVYLPMDFRHSVNLGYAFVNLATHEGALAFRQTFDGFCSWSVESAKTGEVSWANPHQGLAENVERYRNSPVMHPSMPEEYKPMIFQSGVRQQFPPPTKALRAPKLRPANERATPQPPLMM